MMTGTSKGLEKNAILRSSGGRARVVEYITSGGQGEVYRVELGMRQYAMKYYHKWLSTKENKENIVKLIKSRKKSSTFAWPLYLVENGERFGYIMELIPEDYHNINEWIGGRFDTTIEALIKACIDVSSAFQLLHREQLSYKDISPSNVYFNKNSGRALIIDNDNITKNLDKTGMRGTPSYMAPELVVAEKRNPTRITDLHSLATLLFQMLFVEHPLHGKREYNIAYQNESRENIANKLYSPNSAQFIFGDSSDLDRYIEKGVEAHQSARAMWQMYPEYIKSLFIRAFTLGIKEPHQRPTAEEWKDAFIKLLASLYTCPHCGMPHFYDHEEFCRRTNGTPRCKRCEKSTFYPRIKIGESIVVINDGEILYSSYFDSSLEESFEPILRAEYKNGELRFECVGKARLTYKSRLIRRGFYTDKISSGDFIEVNGKPYFIKA